MSEKIILTISVFCSLLIGFFVGHLQENEPCPHCITKEIPSEISIVHFKDLKGDVLNINVSGPARIVWGDEHFVENDGDFQIPIGQIPTENDQSFFEFPYVGNTKTMKFYPSDSYPARGTEIQNRRFFETKESAIQAGFIPMKGMK